MNKVYENDYHKREMIGRWALKDILSIYSSKFPSKHDFTAYTFHAYDMCMFATDPDTSSIKKRFFVEIKTRDRIYDEYILEKDKYDRLMNTRDSLYLSKEECKLLYCNVTLGGAYFWDLDRLDTTTLSTLRCNIATVESRSDKKDKKVYYVRPEEAVVSLPDYKLNANLLEERYYWTEYAMPKVKAIIQKQPRGLNDLFDEFG